MRGPKGAQACWVLLMSGLLAGCQAGSLPETQASPPPTNLDPVKREMLAAGMIELVPDDLTSPELPPEPTQADYGAESYYLICMACHGNWGQGLTVEWRETGFGEDKNCWQSKCHAPNHPPWGFEIPGTAPALLGAGSMPTLFTAYELYRVIAETMPWWNPGSLEDQEAWEITAYLMRARGELPEGVRLDESNAHVIQLHESAAQIVDERPGAFLLVISLFGVLAAFLWRGSRLS